MTTVRELWATFEKFGQLDGGEPAAANVKLAYYRGWLDSLELMEALFRRRPRAEQVRIQLTGLRAEAGRELPEILKKAA